MERALSDEEKFRKAEEIYNRRKNINVTVPSRNLNRSTNTGKKDLKRFKRMLFQIGVCICIYFSIYFIQYSNYYFSSDVIKKVEDILAYDINFNESFMYLKEYMKSNKFFNGVFSFLHNNENDVQDTSVLNTLVENNVLEDTVIENGIVENTVIPNSDSAEEVIENDIENNSIVENSVSNESDIQSNASQNTETNSSLGIGGGEPLDVSGSEEQMRSDAQAVKNNYQITLPLRGTVTSRFGEREIEPKFHTGIDIARNTGSEIISATNGTVILVDEQDGYGKVLKIQNDNVVTLYAHCSEILVNVGDKINIMQNIAKVGSTGNSTGSHLHFEIIYCGRYVNPEYVMEFKE